MPKKITLELEDYHLAALKGISKQKKVTQAKLLHQAMDLLIAHHHFSRIEPEYTRDVDDFIAANRELLKSLFR